MTNLLYKVHLIYVIPGLFKCTSENITVADITVQAIVGSYQFHIENCTHLIYISVGKVFFSAKVCITFSWISINVYLFRNRNFINILNSTLDISIIALKLFSELILKKKEIRFRKIVI